MTIKEKLIAVIDIILDEKIAYRDPEVLSLPIIRFKEMGIYADEFSRIMEKLTCEGCLVSEEDFDICNFDPTYVYDMNYAMVKPNYDKLQEYKNQLKEGSKKILDNLTAGKHKLYIGKKFYTDVKRIKKDIILLYFAQRYGRSDIMKSDQFFEWCQKRYPDQYQSAKNSLQGKDKWLSNGIDSVNDDYIKWGGKKKIIVYEKTGKTFHITEPIAIKTY